MPRDPAKPDKPKDPWKRGPSPVAGGRRGEGEVSTHDLQYATVAAIHGNRRKRHTTDWREGRARLWFAGVAGLRPWSIGTMALQVVMSEAAAVSEVQQQSTAAGPFFGDTQGLPVLLSPAQRPLTATSLVVRDEEAAGSNPVTPTSVSAGQRPIPEGMRASLAASTAANTASTATNPRIDLRIAGGSPNLRCASQVAIGRSQRWGLTCSGTVLGGKGVRRAGGVRRSLDHTKRSGWSGLWPAASLLTAVTLGRPPTRPWIV